MCPDFLADHVQPPEHGMLAHLALPTTIATQHPPWLTAGSCRRIGSCATPTGQQAYTPFCYDLGQKASMESNWPVQQGMKRCDAAVGRSACMQEMHCLNRLLWKPTYPHPHIWRVRTWQPAYLENVTGEQLLQLYAPRGTASAAVCSQHNTFVTVQLVLSCRCIKVHRWWL